MSLSRPSHVSPATGSAQNDVPNGSRRTAWRMIPSWTIPTLCVFVIPIGPVSRPASRIHSSPVSSPLPLRRWLPAKTGWVKMSPSWGMTIVTPVRTGPSPTTSGPSPRTIVA